MCRLTTWPRRRVRGKAWKPPASLPQHCTVKWRPPARRGLRTVACIFLSAEKTQLLRKFPKCRQIFLIERTQQKLVLSLSLLVFAWCLYIPLWLSSMFLMHILFEKMVHVSVTCQIAIRIAIGMFIFLMFLFFSIVSFTPNMRSARSGWNRIYQRSLKRWWSWVSICCNKVLASIADEHKTAWVVILCPYWKDAASCHREVGITSIRFCFAFLAKSLKLELHLLIARHRGCLNPSWHYSYHLQNSVKHEVGTYIFWVIVN